MNQVITLYTGGLDFSGPVEEYFISGGKTVVDTCINLTGFALVGGPASQVRQSKAAEPLRSFREASYGSPIERPKLRCPRQTIKQGCCKGGGGMAWRLRGTATVENVTPSPRSYSCLRTVYYTHGHPTPRSPLVHSIPLGLTYSRALRGANVRIIKRRCRRCRSSTCRTSARCLWSSSPSRSGRRRSSGCTPSRSPFR